MVGYGSAGRRFHPYLLGRVPDFRLVAVATRAPERRAQAEQEHGVATSETVDALLGRAELRVRPEQAARAMAVVDAAMESARTGETVRVTEDGA
jgi:predicted dehydrogenase